MKDRLNKFKSDLRLWEARWSIEPHNCRKSLKAYIWLIPLFLTFRLFTEYKKK
jgi:hypothetical protein